jgi:hypothetical protein
MGTNTLGQLCESGDPLGKDPVLAAYIGERLSRRTRNLRQDIHVTKLCDAAQEVDHSGLSNAALDVHRIRATQVPSPTLQSIAKASSSTM